MRNQLSLLFFPQSILCEILSVSPEQHRLDFSQLSNYNYCHTDRDNPEPGYVRDSRDGIYYTLQKTKPEHYEMEHLLKIKEKNLKKILLECEHWTNMDWKEAEKMTPRFFERIEVHQGYQLNYRIVPEIQQFLPVMIDLENE